MSDTGSNDEQGAADYAWAHNTRLPYDMGFYGSADVPDRREAEADEREMR